MAAQGEPKKAVTLQEVADAIREMRPSVILSDELDTLLLKLIEEARTALQLYADPWEGMWEPCEDNGESGLHRYYITGTCHPREPARRAMERLGLATGDGRY